MERVGSSRLWALSAVVQTAQNAIHVAGTSFKDVASLEVSEEKGAKVYSDLGLNPWTPRKPMVLRCSL